MLRASLTQQQLTVFSNYTVRVCACACAVLPELARALACSHNLPSAAQRLPNRALLLLTPFSFHIAFDVSLCHHAAQAFSVELGGPIVSGAVEAVSIGCGAESGDFFRWEEDDKGGKGSH